MAPPPLTFLSVCSGIDAASVALLPLGWQCLGFSEIEKFPSAVLRHHYPDVPNFGDLTKFHEWPTHLRPDLICGGTPCQSFSVAGLRAGLADPRGNLALTFLALVERYRPRWVFWENVPGVLSSTSLSEDGPGDPPDDLDEGFGFLEVDTEEQFDADESHAFGCFLSGLSELGYGFAYRTLDAQYFGVPQRRRRPFVVGHLGDWRRPAAVLFESQSLRGDPPPRRQAGERPAPTISARTQGGGGLGTDFDLDGGLIGVDLTNCLISGDISGTLEAGQDRGIRGQCVMEVAFPLTAGMSASAARMPHEQGALVPIAFAENSRAEIRMEGGDGQVTGALSTGGGKPGQGTPSIAYTIHGTDKTARVASETDTAGCLRTKPPGSIENSSTTVISTHYAVRRLTPRECERLQGFPDDYTLIPWRGKPAADCPDGPRYKALGNSWAVPCARWIGERIALVDAIP